MNGIDYNAEYNNRARVPEFLKLIEGDRSFPATKRVADLVRTARPDCSPADRAVA